MKKSHRTVASVAASLMTRNEKGRQALTKLPTIFTLDEFHRAFGGTTKKNASQVLSKLKGLGTVKVAQKVGNRCVWAKAGKS